MKKAIIVVVIATIVVVGAIAGGIYLANNKNKKTIENEIAMIKSNIKNGSFNNAEIEINRLKTENPKLQSQEAELNNELKLAEENSAYENLKPFLSNNTLSGTIDGNCKVTMLLNDATKSNGEILAEEYYNQYANQRLNLEIKSVGSGKCIIDESQNGQKTGTYNLTFTNTTATGTFKDVATGKVSPVDLTFNSTQNNTVNTSSKNSNESSISKNQSLTTSNAVNDGPISQNEVLNLFFKGNSEKIQNQEQLYNYLQKTYGVNDLSSFYQYQMDYQNNSNIPNYGMGVYVMQQGGVTPSYFIDKKIPVYNIGVWENPRVSIFVDGKGNQFEASQLKEVAQNGNLYTYENGEFSQVNPQQMRFSGNQV